MPHKNPEANRAYQKKYRETHHEQWRAYMKEYHKEWYARDKKKASVQGRDRHLKVKYGLTEIDIEALAIDQQGRCAICRKILLVGSFTHVDHDHETGSIRGLLCVNCNLGLGAFFHRPELLRAAAEYLNRKDQAGELIVWSPKEEAA